MLIAAGAAAIERYGLRVRFEKDDLIASLHGPHSAKEAEKDRWTTLAPSLMGLELSMKNVIEHQGYCALVAFDPDDDIFVGHVAGINDVVSFHADTVDGIRVAFVEAVEDYLEACAKIGKSAEKAACG